MSQPLYGERTVRFPWPPGAETEKAFGWRYDAGPSWGGRYPWCWVPKSQIGIDKAVRCGQWWYLTLPAWLADRLPDEELVQNVYDA